AVVHGLHERPGPDAVPFEIPAGSTREQRFRAGAPGTYFYWATTTGAKDYGSRDLDNADSQLVGAFVVDPPSGSAPDRIFVLNGVSAKEDAFHDGLGTF